MTAPTVSSTKANGAPNRAQGSFSGTYTAATDVFTGTGGSAGISLAAGVITLALGFVPTYFKIVNVTDRITQEWFKGMNKGDFIETAANGVRTLETDDKVVVNEAVTGTAPVQYNPAATVVITVDGGAMTDNDTVVWVAEG